MRTKLIILSCLTTMILGVASGQTRMIVVGNVYAATTKEPLAYATVGVTGHTEQTTTNAEGHFEFSIPVEYQSDSLRVTYIGFHAKQLPIATRQSVENIYLEESATLLDEVTIVHRKMRLRDVDRSAKKIRDRLYAMEAEVTNAEYNSFLGHLEEHNQKEQLKKYRFDLSGYSKSEREFFERYSSPFRDIASGDTVRSFQDYPAVNVPYEGAVKFCEWLTEYYNSSTKNKKFKKVLFRLPTLKEWQIAALGYPKFQTWDLEEVEIDVIINPDTLQMLPNKGKKVKMKVGKEVWYPWHNVPHYHNLPYNNYYCYLGNFRIDKIVKPCISVWAGFDGWIMMGLTASYFPNGMGLYDVVGNVAEMIDEKGKACGGSWNDVPKDATIHSIKTYTGPDRTVGFRVFMEVIEP